MMYNRLINERYSPLRTKKVKIEYSNEELLDHLRELSVKIGKTPSGWDITKAGKISPSRYQVKFGSIVNAQKLAGLVPNERVKVIKVFTNEELLSHLKDLSKKLGKTPTVNDVLKADKYSLIDFYRNFGSFVNAQKVAGLALNQIKAKKYTDKELIDHLLDLSKQLGRTPRAYDINKAGKVNNIVFYKNFGSLINAQKAAGLVHNTRGKTKSTKA